MAVVRGLELVGAIVLVFVAASTLVSLLVLGDHPSWWRSLGLACGTLAFAVRWVGDACR